MLRGPGPNGHGLQDDIDGWQKKISRCCLLKDIWQYRIREIPHSPVDPMGFPWWAILRNGANPTSDKVSPTTASHPDCFARYGLLFFKVCVDFQVPRIYTRSRRGLPATARHPPRRACWTRQPLGMIASFPHGSRTWSAGPLDRGRGEKMVIAPGQGMPDESRYDRRVTRDSSPADWPRRK
ncbi:hypothetical protein BO71DRAFT_78680 [Aspergillus ellipticus CBS 707.79]|uniref:Uncharacterized protein n=1 Tax=Aspergillus ellipticus CBS 707.79 TaxID=1448320 RepID=A0A319DVC5_9EURO|nr:hypothetical protein BO71DRAFT_78680 [Aspergillus ellipticus CBS 707.79]